jgi:hypothetical protein
MKNKIITKSRNILFVLSLLTLIQSCGIGLIVRGAAKNKITVEKKVVPPDFIKRDQTLIILMWGDKSYDRYAMKAFKRFYTGKMEFVPFNDLLTNPKYEDLEAYPYVFSQGPGELKMYEGGSYSYTFSGGRPFHIFDRAEKTFYTSPFTSSFFYRIMQAYAKKLNTFIK